MLRIERELQALVTELREITPPSAQILVDAMEYALFGGGKRFRPRLVLATAGMIGLSEDRVAPYAAAVEMVHTYSLIHDDLPCMDDDDIRRGRPTVHKEFSEAVALLAGDALLAEAPRWLAKRYQNEPDLGLKCVDLLLSATHSSGMIGGQVMDLTLQNPDQNHLKQIHDLKTGRLIEVSVTGPACLARLNSSDVNRLKCVGQTLGFAFQLADDLEDFDPEAPEANGYPAVIGESATRRLLSDTRQTLIGDLESWGPGADPLIAMVEFNSQRVNVESTNARKIRGRSPSR
jgi:geranylgeranyl diphosphate synthase, type II